MGALHRREGVEPRASGKRASEDLSVFSRMVRLQRLFGIVGMLLSWAPTFSVHLCFAAAHVPCCVSTVVFWPACRLFLAGLAHSAYVFFLRRCSNLVVHRCSCKSCSTPVFFKQLPL